MQINSISANNFKSLIDFKLDLAKFNCLIGLNGAGKSTVLQFVDFLAQQVRGDMKDWLAQRHWKAKDLHSKLTTRKNIEFNVEIKFEEGGGGVSWKASFNTTQLHCSSERIQTPGAVLEVKEGHLRIMERTGTKAGDRVVLDQVITFDYEGSILSQLRESILVKAREELPVSLLTFKNYLSSIRSLDLLSPDYLRQRTRSSDGTLGLAGQRLSAFLYEIGPEKRSQLCETLKRVYPQLEDLESKSLRSGWKQMEILERYGGKNFVTEARHVNDGMLRLIAILAELSSDHDFLLFDEIENGINPELVEFLIQALTSARQQIVVTTHSPMILNYLDDETAKSGVMYLYKTAAGYTKSVPFFSIPSLKEKLTVMGPGEAFVDTNLTQLADEIAGLATERP